MRTIILLLFLICSVGIISGQGKYPVGRVIDTIKCKDHPDHSYSVYLPSTYRSSTSWPVIFVYDAAGRGINSAKIFSLAGEKHGFIIIGSHNFTNGPFDMGATAIDNLFEDVPKRFSIDKGKMYVSGLSGGARMATATAVLAESIQGVIGFAAGTHPDFPIRRTAKFAWIGVVGNRDTNYAEMIDLHEKLDRYGVKNLLLSFDGPHAWPPDETIADACGWMKLLTASPNKFKNDLTMASLLDEMIEKAKQEYQSENIVQAVYNLQAAKQYLAKTHRTSDISKLLEEYQQTPEAHQHFFIHDSLQNIELQVQSEINPLLYDLDKADPHLSILKLKERIHSFIKAERESPTIESAYVYNRLLGFVALQTFTNGNPHVYHGDYDKALNYLVPWQATHPDSYAMAHYLAKVYALAGKNGKALKLYQTAIDNGLEAPQDLGKKELLTRLKDRKLLWKALSPSFSDWL